jgi:hypothetical protein
VAGVGVLYVRSVRELSVLSSIGHRPAVTLWLFTERRNHAHM